MNEAYMPSLEKKLGAVRDVLKGWYLPLNTFSKTRKYINIDAFAIELSEYLPENLKNDEKDLFELFFRMTFSYIESSCNDEDKIFISIRKIAGTVTPLNGADSVFDIIINNVEDFYRAKKEKEYWVKCKALHSEFKNKLPKSFDSQRFTEGVASAIEGFLGNKNCIMTEESFCASPIGEVIDSMLAQICTAYYETIQDDMYE